MRSLEFEPEEVLLTALDVFWTKGVEHTSISDLVAATGVQRSGLYNVFGNKEELFKQSVEAYLKRLDKNVFAGIYKDDARISDIRDFFNHLANMASDPSSARGCLMCNTATSMSKEAGYVTDLIEQRFNRLERGFYNALKRSRDDGEIEDKADNRQLAQYFVANILSLSNLCRTPVGRNLAPSYFAELTARIDGLIKFKTNNEINA